MSLSGLKRLVSASLSKNKNYFFEFLAVICFFFVSDPLSGKIVHHKSQFNTKNVNFDLKLKRKPMHAAEVKTVSSLKKAP